MKLSLSQAVYKTLLGGIMHIWINTVKGKSINLEIEDSSETIDIKIHGEATRKLVVVLGQDPDPGTTQDDDALMRIFVSTLGGKTFNLEVNGSMTIKQIKNMIREQGGPPVNKQKLFFQSKQLKDTLTVGDCELKMDSNLVLMSELCGC